MVVDDTRDESSLLSPVEDEPPDPDPPPTVAPVAGVLEPPDGFCEPTGVGLGSVSDANVPD